MASDIHGREMERPMEIQVLVGDENDNEPVCESEDSIFEVQEDEPVGKMCVSGRVSERGRGSECSCNKNFNKV